ncbi:MAG: hypothetical protein ACO1OB_02655 [Archangium sp.]
MSILTVPMAIALVVGAWLREKKALEFEKIAAQLAERRFAAAVELAVAGRRRWRPWPDGAFLQGIAELMLWRIPEASASWKQAYPMTLVPDRAREREVFFWSVVAAELEGDAAKLREHRWFNTLARERRLVVDVVRAARQRDFDAVLSKLSALPVATPFEPLCNALSSWARDVSLSDVDRIVLLGETGIDQVRRVWPEFADFLERAPAVSVIERPLPLVSDAR